MSGMNYIGGRHVYEDVNDRVRALPGQKVVLSWIPERDGDLEALTPRIREAVSWYRKGLIEHIHRHNVDRDALQELRTEVYLGRNCQIYVRAVAIDDRGVEHVAYVRQ